MTIEVNIPSVSITGAIGRDLLDHGINMPDNDLAIQIKNVVRDKFIRKYEQNKMLLKDAGHPGKICIEVQDDMGEKRPHALASFNLFRSNMTGDIHFTVSSHLVYSELLAGRKLASFEYNIADEGYWSHEFVHLMDWQMLNKYREQYETSRKTRHVSSLFGDLPGADEYQLPREWETLSALASYRDEGLAVLYEYLCNEAQLPVPADQAKALFVKEAGSLLSYEHRPFGIGDGQALHPEAFMSWMKQFRGLSYAVGPYWVMDGILTYASTYPEKITPELPALLSKVTESMSGRKASGIERNSAIKIIRTGLKLDLGSYIELLTNKAHKHPWGNFLELEGISELFNYLSYAGGEPAENFMKDIYQSIQHRDRGLLLRTIKEIIGLSMFSDEIKQGFEDWQKNEANLKDKSSVGHEIAERIRKLMGYYANTSDEQDAKIAAMALTYIFDPEDYILDEMSVVGLMDDLYVLRAACALLNVG